MEDKPLGPCDTAPQRVKEATGPGFGIMHTLASITFDQRDPVDRLMAEVIARLEAAGQRLGGVVQVAAQGCAGAMALRDLDSHAEIPILQDLGRDATACRLDAQALAEAAGRVEQSLRTGIDLLVINRFGKAEAEGHGLRHIFGEAVSRGVPTLTAVRRDHAAAWQAFHGGLAIDLPFEADAVIAWCREAAREHRQPAGTP